jgi:CRP/FNR family cyclic AMP-dependent transcriptional regulator
VIAGEASDSDDRRTAQWRDRREPVQRARPATYSYLLDLDDDLAQGFDLRMRLVARHAVTAAVFAEGPGTCDLGPRLEAIGHGPGLLVLEGLLAVESRVGDRTAAELVGTGDLLQPSLGTGEAMLDTALTWRALWPSRFAILDGAFAERARPWPEISQTMLRRAGRRTWSLDVLRAIACQPRLEVRLVLLLWHLASRWGRVERSGIRLCLPLTHRLLGQLVGAERPSVSHALRRLARAELVTGSAGDLHLIGTVDHHLAFLVERTAAHDEPGSIAGLQERRRADAAS